MSRFLGALGLLVRTGERERERWRVGEGIFEYLECEDDRLKSSKEEGGELVILKWGGSLETTTCFPFSSSPKRPYSLALSLPRRVSVPHHLTLTFPFFPSAIAQIPRSTIAFLPFRSCRHPMVFSKCLSSTAAAPVSPCASGVISMRRSLHVGASRRTAAGKGRAGESWDRVGAVVGESPCREFGVFLCCLVTMGMCTRCMAVLLMNCWEL
jgi:hypothetical protein